MGNVPSMPGGSGESPRPSSSQSSGFSFPFFSKQPEVPQEPEEYVIVPPVISIDRQEVNRMAFSSYDWVAHRRSLQLLLNEFLKPGATARFNFVPPAQQIVLTSANLRLPDALRKGWAKFLADGPDEQGLGETWADVAVRAHPRADDPHSFLSIIVGNSHGFLWPGVHFAAQSQEAGPGLFGSMPLNVQQPDASLLDTTLGARYASPALSTGLAVQPFKGACLEKWWVLWRHNPRGSPDTHMTFGAQSAPRMRLDEIVDSGKAEQLVAPANTSYFLQYESGAKDSRFSIFVESIEAARVRLSYYHHLARVRRVYNLFEDDDVVGITNYLDFGAAIDMPLAGDGGLKPAPSRFEVAAAWQVNSNVLIKTAVTSARVCGAFVFKSWWDPAVSLSLMGGWNHQQHAPCAGVSLHVDNDTERRYERGLHTVGTGSLARQKHVASKAESMVAKKSRMVVRGGDADRAEADAKVLVPPEVTHRSSALL